MIKIILLIRRLRMPLDSHPQVASRDGNVTASMFRIALIRRCVRRRLIRQRIARVVVAVPWSRQPHGDHLHRSMRRHAFRLRHKICRYPRSSGKCRLRRHRVGWHVRAERRRRCGVGLVGLAVGVGRSPERVRKLEQIVIDHRRIDSVGGGPSTSRHMHRAEQNIEKRQLAGKIRSRASTSIL